MTPTPAPAELVELLPCPFCGGRDIGHQWIETYSTDSSYDVFGCRSCGARFEEGDAAQWNTRASLAAHRRVEVTGLLQEARDQIQRLAGGFAEPDSLIRRIDAALEKTP